MTRAEELRKNHIEYIGLSNAELATRLENSGFCTHYPGFTRDKDFLNGACHACIRRWMKGRINHV